jgi:chromosome segregation ATPase
MEGGEEAHGERHHDKLGRALSELFENPLVSGAIGRALGARERAAQAQELWMGALNLPSAADIERLTRRVRSVSQRLEGVEDGVSRLGHSLVQASGLERRLISIEERLGAIEERLGAIDEHLASCEGPLRALRAELEGLREGARSGRARNP